MTFLTKPSFIVKKTPLIEGKCDEEVIEVHPPTPYWRSESRMSLSSLLCLTLVAFLVTLIGTATGFMLYRHYVRSMSVHRYKGFCTIPINVKDPAFYEPNYRAMPLRWSAEPDVQVFSAAEEDSSDDLVNALREELDIGEAVEKISVVDNGRNVDFIHDFEANLTGIVDPERCFTMDLDPATVLSPEVFVLSIEGGGDFDVSRVRSTLRAALPALQAAGLPALQAAALGARCPGRPVYRLLKDEGVIIRKRGADAPPHDYIQFSGRHVQEIEIVNLADILQHEQANRGE